jgi:hypothetical protein
MSECRDCEAIEVLVTKMYDQVDIGQTVQTNLIAAATVLASIIASCSSSDQMLTLATDILKKLTDHWKDADIWSQTVMPVLSHSELAWAYARCPTHLDWALDFLGTSMPAEIAETLQARKQK